MRFESGDSCKHRDAYTEYYIDFREVPVNLSKTKRAYSRFVSFIEKAEALLLNVKKKFSSPRTTPLLFLREWNQSRENSHSCFPFIFVTNFVSDF